MKVRYLDLGMQWTEIRNEAEPILANIFASGGFIGGEQMEMFEKEFAAYIGTQHCIGMNSGTGALHFCLRSWGIGPGDEVILPTNTFVATAGAVALAGAKPVLVDIESDGIHATLEEVKRAVTSRTRAIIPVHLFGHCIDLSLWREFADSRGIKLLEDACQAHGASINGKNAGSFGHAAAFSFYPGKNLGACGDAGALVTDDKDLYQKMLMIRNHGVTKAFDHQIVGSTERMDAIQAAVLRIKLKRLDDWNEHRRMRAAQYVNGLSGIDNLWLPRWAKTEAPCHHLFVLRHSERDALAQHLGEQGIGAGMHYPVPIHLMPAYKSLGLERGSLPNAEKACETGISLPMGPHLSSQDCDEVIKVILDFFEK